MMYNLQAAACIICPSQVERVGLALSAYLEVYDAIGVLAQVIPCPWKNTC